MPKDRSLYQIREHTAFQILFCSVAIIGANNDIISFFFLILTACLKFLSPKSIENLVVHGGSGLDAVVNRIIYKSDDDDYDSYQPEANSTYLLQHAEATKFNLFTGFQTLPEREDSFKVLMLTNMHFFAS
jgi:hypothetical protein